MNPYQSILGLLTESELTARNDTPGDPDFAHDRLRTIAALYRLGLSGFIMAEHLTDEDLADTYRKLYLARRRQIGSPNEVHGLDQR